MMWLGPDQDESPISHISLALMHKLNEIVLMSSPPLQCILIRERILVNSKQMITKM